MSKARNISNFPRELKPSKEFGEKYKLLLENDNLISLRNDLEKHLCNSATQNCSIHYESLNKQLASVYLATGEEAKAINRLTEAHAIIHRRQVDARFTKAEIRHQCGLSDNIHGINPQLMTFDITSIDGPNSLRNKLKELPEEWHVVQLTIPYGQRNSSQQKSATHPIHITVMPAGNKNADPLCITLPKPNTDMYDICKEIMALLEKNRVQLKTEYENHASYWAMRLKQNKILETAVNEMEQNWFREWRILLVADPLESNKIDNLHKMIDKLINDDPSGKTVSARDNWLLKKITTCAFCLDRSEISRAVQYILPNHPKLANNIVLCIQGKQKDIAMLEKTKRKTVVLIIDEHMDYLPLERMTILKHQPVTRFSCIQLAYALFKEHEDSMEAGCKILKFDEKDGTFIVNPGSDLPKMSKRLKVFIDYWLPHWNGIYNEIPSEETFSKALTNYNTLMYNGHGSGIQYFPGEEIERLRIKSNVLLFGCSSIKLLPVGGKFPPYGVCNQYLTACSPCILGMLWEVTDGDTDKMTASLISHWIPSLAPRPWSDVDTSQWLNGVLKFKTDKKNVSTIQEPELLRAFAEAKEVCSQYMTAAASVVRGLPIKLKY